MAAAAVGRGLRCSRGNPAGKWRTRGGTAARGRRSRRCRRRRWRPIRWAGCGPTARRWCSPSTRRATSSRRRATAAGRGVRGRSSRTASIRAPPRPSRRSMGVAGTPGAMRRAVTARPTAGVPRTRAGMPTEAKGEHRPATRPGDARARPAPLRPRREPRRRCPSRCSSPARCSHDAEKRASWRPQTRTMQTTDIRKGLKIQIDGVPYAIVEHQFVKPGKGQSFTRCRIKNLQTGAVIERTWKSGESVELADVETRKMTYSWDEGDSLVFMDSNTGDQIHVQKDVVGEEVRFLSEGLDCDVTIYNGNPIGLDLPPSVVLQIKNSEPGIKGDTASGATKPATLSTGATVNVPLFVKEGEWVKVDTRTGEYLERVNR